MTKLRVCASCEWIFKISYPDIGCPKCGFAHYSARYVYDNDAYRYQYTQKPWMKRKLDNYRYKLLSEIEETGMKKFEKLRLGDLTNQN